jgi:hypothetical protein
VRKIPSRSSPRAIGSAPTKELREENELGKRVLKCDGPGRLYTFMRLWEEFTTKHDLVS